MQGCLRPPRAQAGPRGPSSTIPVALVRAFPLGPRDKCFAPWRCCVGSDRARPALLMQLPHGPGANTHTTHQCPLVQRGRTRTGRCVLTVATVCRLKGTLSAGRLTKVRMPREPCQRGGWRNREGRTVCRVGSQRIAWAKSASSALEATSWIGEESAGVPQARRRGSLRAARAAR